MKSVALRVVIAAALVGLGWAAGQAAQTPQADFEIEVSSPAGTTTITCVRGCGLQGSRYKPDQSAARPSVEYTCGSFGQQCGGAVHGFVTR